MLLMNGLIWRIRSFVSLNFHFMPNRFHFDAFIKGKYYISKGAEISI